MIQATAFSQLAVVSDLLIQSSFCTSMLSYINYKEIPKYFPIRKAGHVIEYWLLNHQLCILVIQSKTKSLSGFHLLHLALAITFI